MLLGGFLGGPGSCGACRVWAPLARLSQAVSGLRCSAVGWRLCGLGHARQNGGRDDVMVHRVLKFLMLSITFLSLFLFFHLYFVSFIVFV